MIVKLRSQASAASHVIIGWIEHRTGVFDDVRKVPGAVGRIHRGIRTVPVGQIGGSVGRCSEFDRDFFPAKASVKERWKRIDWAFRRGEELPPVSLYKVGGFYFALDGHHRVSVAYYHGADWVARLLLGVLRKDSPESIHIVRVNGQPGIIGYLADGRAAGVRVIEASEGRIGAIRFVLNPEKLRAVALLGQVERKEVPE